MNRPNQPPPMQARIRALEALYHISQASVTDGSLPAIYEELVQSSRNAFLADRVSLWLREPADGPFQLMAVSGREGLEQSTKLGAVMPFDPVAGADMMAGGA